MKKITSLSIISILLISIGTILIIEQNHIGEWLIIPGAIIGLYTCYILDLHEGDKQENQI